MKTYYGIVLFFKKKDNSNFGFISWRDPESSMTQSDMFFHFSDIVMNGYKSLEKEDKVKFKIGENRQGKPKAIEIEKISEAEYAANK
jgi:cold shock CspA family protein